MDSHTFSDPILVVDSSSSQQPLLLTWQVQVLRRDAVPVGTLLIHAQNLPPRKRKGKIVWQLPETASQGPPRFGPLEQKRLWELFKQQKKERRAKQRQLQGGGGGGEEDENGVIPGEPEVQEVEEALGKLDVLSSDHLLDDPSEPATATGESSSSSSTQQLVGSAVSNSPFTTEIPVSSARSPPLPPGFETVVSSPTPTTSTAIHVPFVNETVPIAKLSVSPTPAPPLRPPPGMIPIPPGITSVPPPPQQQQSYFPLLSTAPLSTLGALVVQTFLQSMTWTTTHNSTTLPTTTTSTTIPTSALENLEWLRYYQETAIQTLLVGSVQAPVCTTPAQRSAQWQSLTARTAHWECHGCTIQPVTANSSMSSTSTAALVVLTGQTQEATTGRLAYTLSLLLVSSDYSTTTTTPATDAADPISSLALEHDRGSAVVHWYSIANAVVTLLALTTAATTTSTTTTPYHL